MRYIVNVTEMLMSEVIVEADSLHAAKKKAREAVIAAKFMKVGGVSLHHDSNTKEEGELLPSDYQEGGQYHNEQVVE